jgi:error-prone DNA polymerase
MIAYAELIVTTNFSFLRGASHPQEMVAPPMSSAALPSASPTAIHLPAWCAPIDEARNRKIKLLVGTRLVTIDGFEVLAYPTDRPAYGRLCRSSRREISKPKKANAI